MGLTSLAALRDALQAAWSADTSASSEWSEENAAKGQCAVTACVVQDYFGGDILRTIATLPNGQTVSHYFNLIDGQTVDCTHQQFPDGTTFSEPAPKTKGLASTRDYCLSYPHTAWRYELLRTQVAAHLHREK